MFIYRSFINCHDNKSQGDCVKKNIDSWRTRNDSSEVNAVLCLDNLLPETMPFEKLTLTSKKSQEPTLARKPVKECYCCVEANKSLSRIRRKRVLSCYHCKSHPEVGTIKETEGKIALSPSISCETVRRIQKINYTPTSQFLQNVQNKIYDLQSGGEGDYLETCPRSLRYHKFIASTKNIVPNERAALFDKCKQVDNRQTSPTTPQMPINSLVTSDSEQDNCTVSTDKGLRTSSQKPVKSKLCKTVKSRKHVSGTKEERPIHQIRQQPDLLNRDKRGIHLLKNYHYPKHLTERMLSFNEDTRREKYNSPRYYKQDQCSKHDDGSIANNATDQEMANLKQFREQNYFETHGSSHTLASCKSMGSLQQYLLNQRLFAEPMGRIHKQDLVVTIPPCSTIQNKRIHYFPRYVVRQEKNLSNTNYKRKRCQSCPLTGHTIDLGILKTEPLLNSLALKYQKRAP